MFSCRSPAVIPSVWRSPDPCLSFCYADSGIHVQCCLWTARANFLELRNLIQCEIKEAFAEAGIEIPYPRRALVAGNRTEPLPVRILRGETSQS